MKNNNRKTDGLTNKISMLAIAIAVSSISTFYLLDRGDNKTFQKDMVELTTQLVGQQAATYTHVQNNSVTLERLEKEQKGIRDKVNKTHTTMRVYCEKSRPYWTEHSGDCL